MSGILKTVGGVINPITSAAGIKLFPGGPYSDGGALDRQQQQTQPLYNAGMNMLQQGMNLPQLQQMGMLQYMPQIFAQLSGLTGVQNPLTGQQNGVNRGSGGNLMDGANFGLNQNTQDNSPFALNPVQQSQLNAQNSQTSRDYANQMGRFRSHMASRGLSGSSLNGAEAYLRSQMLKQQNQNRGAAQYGAYQNRLDTVGQMGSMLNNLYGQQAQRQQQMLGNAQSLINPQIQNTGAQANLAAQNSANTGGAFGSLLGAYLGGAFRQPQQRNPYAAPGQNSSPYGPPTPQSALMNSTWNWR